MTVNIRCPKCSARVHLPDGPTEDSTAGVIGCPKCGRTLTRPPITLSQWRPWQDRSTISGGKSPGVYVIGRFADASPPSGLADPLDPHVIYIGKTARRLMSRLETFERKRRKNQLLYGPYLSQELFVSVMPSPAIDLWWDRSKLCRDWTLKYGEQKAFEMMDWQDNHATAKDKGSLNQAWLLFVERQFLFDFTLLHGELPACNRE